MTRETKIGLLVGLAFIIVIGILLSDHINSSGEPPRADPAQAYTNLKDSIGAPNVHQAGATDTVIVPQPVVPQNRIMTDASQDNRTEPSGPMIQISPGGDPSKLQFPNRPANVQGPMARANDGAGQNGSAPLVASGADQAGNNESQVTGAVPANNGVSNESAIERLARAAREQNMELVNRDGSAVGISTGPVKPVVTPVANPEGKQVTAEENDTVSKFASKYMGANTKANREAIIKANPSVGPDGSKVFAGKTYLIPAPAAGGSQSAPAASPVVLSPPQQPKPTVVAQQTPPPVAATSTYAMYTVKDTDTLWKIASEQLGSGARYTEIQDLNADVLKGKSAVRANMRLKLPAKAVASSN